MNEFKDKYLKYKNKYLDLKQIGGAKGYLIPIFRDRNGLRIVLKDVGNSKLKLLSTSDTSNGSTNTLDILGLVRGVSFLNSFEINIDKNRYIIGFTKTRIDPGQNFKFIKLDDIINIIDKGSTNEVIYKNKKYRLLFSPDTKRINFRILREIDKKRINKQLLIKPAAAAAGVAQGPAGAAAGVAQGPAGAAVGMAQQGPAGAAAPRVAQQGPFPIVQRGYADGVPKLKLTRQSSGINIDNNIYVKNYMALINSNFLNRHIDVNIARQNASNASIILMKDDNILLLKLKPNKLGVPGGNIETGDTIELTAIKEYMEETGADLPKIENVRSYYYSNYRSFIYIAQTKSNISYNKTNVKHNESEDYGFINKDNLKKVISNTRGPLILNIDLKSEGNKRYPLRKCNFYSFKEIFDRGYI
jgi:hypothetical protein